MAYVIKITETFHSPDNNRMVLSCMNSCKNKMQPKYVHNSSDVKWYEIDDEEDLKYAEENVVKCL